MVIVFLTHGVLAQIEQDKALHFLGGNLYGLAGAGIAKQISDGNRWWTFAGAIGGSALIGLGKEAVDSSQRPGGWDNDDLLATILGGATVGITIDVFTDHKKKRMKRRMDLALTKNLPEKQMKNRLDQFLDTGYLPSFTTLSMTYNP